ncbi:MAG TPA: CopD family protein [Aliidongia sp.]|nr:CopD family protein [Aliidongia sp.]
MILGLALHILAAIIWVGGMFFAHQALRPALGPVDPAIRLPIWRHTLERFFRWVWLAIVTLLVTGWGIVYAYFGGFEHLGLHIHIMQGTGILMMLLFFHLYFAPWKRFRRAVDAEDFTQAAAQLAQIRRIVGINLVLGLLTAVIGATGRYW